MDITIKQAVEAIIARVPGAPFLDTVDTIKVGDPDQKITSIVVTFMATYEVIEKSIQLGANFIITHEPTYYNHLDKTDQFANDPAYTAKRRLLEEHQIVIWRFHDYLHNLAPDPTMIGILYALGWSGYALPEDPGICQIPPCTFNELTTEIKSKLGLSKVRTVGNLESICSKVGISVGASGGESHLQILGRSDVDVLVVGEIHEWETNEYVRDAQRIGQNKALVVIGHAASEEPGMQEVLKLFRVILPQVKITFIPVGNPFKWL